MCFLRCARARAQRLSSSSKTWSSTSVRSSCVSSSAERVCVFYPQENLSIGSKAEVTGNPAVKLDRTRSRFVSNWLHINVPPRRFDRARASALTSHDGQQQQWPVQRESGGPGPVPGGRKGGPSQDSAGHHRGWRYGSKGPKVRVKY